MTGSVVLPQLGELQNFTVFQNGATFRGIEAQFYSSLYEKSAYAQIQYTPYSTEYGVYAKITVDPALHSELNIVLSPTPPSSGTRFLPPWALSVPMCPEFERYVNIGFEVAT